MTASPSQPSLSTGHSPESSERRKTSAEAQPTVGVTIPRWQMILVYMRKVRYTWAWVAASKQFLPGSCPYAPALTSCPDFPSWWTVEVQDETNPFLSKLRLGIVFYHSKRVKLEHTPIWSSDLGFKYSLEKRMKCPWRNGCYRVRVRDLEDELEHSVAFDKHRKLHCWGNIFPLGKQEWPEEVPVATAGTADQLKCRKILTTQWKIDTPKSMWI